MNTNKTMTITVRPATPTEAVLFHQYMRSLDTQALDLLAPLGSPTKLIEDLANSHEAAFVEVNGEVIALAGCLLVDVSEEATVGCLWLALAEPAQNLYGEALEVTTGLWKDQCNALTICVPAEDDAAKVALEASGFHVTGPATYLGDAGQHLTQYTKETSACVS